MGLGSWFRRLGAEAGASIDPPGVAGAEGPRQAPAPLSGDERFDVIDSLAPLERRLRARTLVSLRWLAVAGQSVTVLFVAAVLHHEIPLALTLAVIATSAWFNVIISFMFPGARYLSDGEAGLQILFDIAQLAALVGITGGLSNPFVVLLGAPVVIAFASLRAKYAAVVGVFAAAAAAAMIQWSGPLPWPEGQSFEPPRIYLIGMLAALVTGAGFTALFAWRAAADARRMTLALAATREILSREQRLSALGGLAAAAAHELGTPLGTIQVVAKEMAHAAPPGSDLAEDAALLVSQSKRCREILAQLSKRGAEQDAMHAELSLRMLLEEVVEPLKGLGPEIELIFEPPNGQAWPETPSPRLQRRPEVLYAVSNYVENALDYARGQITVTGRWSDDWVEVEVRDDGPGFSLDLLVKLGEPFVTKRDPGAPARGGLGLGFFIAKTFVERTGGQVEFGNQRAPATGAIVRARWPRAAVAAPASFVGERDAPGPRGF